MAFMQAAIGVIFLIACLAKSFAPKDGTARLLRNVGVPSVVVIPLSTSLPVVEGLLGICLLLGILTLPAAWAAAAISCGFCATLIRAYRLGAREPCNCFGRLDPTPISSLSLVRAIVLTLACLAIVVSYTSSPPMPMNTLRGQGSIVRTLGAAGSAIALVASFLLLERVQLLVTTTANTMRAGRLIGDPAGHDGSRMGTSNGTAPK